MLRKVCEDGPSARVLLDAGGVQSTMTSDPLLNKNEQFSSSKSEREERNGSSNGQKRDRR